MYGLMKANICARHGGEANLHRLHYCGTCKTIGALYGQKSRFFLNNDTVFLSELLTALSPDQPDAKEWGRAYQSFNCFALPNPEEELPLSLQLSARATLVMVEFMVSDRREDSGKGRWGLVTKLYSSEFYEASKWLLSRGFPMKTMREWRDKQAGREANVLSKEFEGAPSEKIDYVAEPTATLTALMFQHSVAALGGSEQVQSAMYELGFAFGSLVYTLDSFEDFEDDLKKAEFNALKEAYNLASADVSPEMYAEVIGQLQSGQAQVETAIRALPLAQPMSDTFIARLRANMNRRLGLETATSCAVHAPTPRRSLRDNWTNAVKLAHRLTAEHCAEKPSFSRRLFAPFSYLTVLGAGLLFPQSAQNANSVKECRDFALNLMVIGSAVGSFGSRFSVPAFAGGSPNVSEIRNGRRTSSSSQPRITRVPGQSRGCGCCEACACDCCSSCACDCCADIACCEMANCCDCCAGGCACG